MLFFSQQPRTHFDVHAVLWQIACAHAPCSFCCSHPCLHRCCRIHVFTGPRELTVQTSVLFAHVGHLCVLVPFSKNMQNRTATVVAKAVSCDGKPRVFAKAAELGADVQKTIGARKLAPTVRTATATTGSPLPPLPLPPLLSVCNFISI